MLRRGDLIHQITIEEFVLGSPQQTASGEPAGEWVAFATDLWARVHPMSVRALFAAQQAMSEARVQIEIDYLEGVSAAMRVVFESRIYRILGIIDKDEKHEELQLVCAEGLDRNG